jgi:hypothetical protein
MFQAIPGFYQNEKNTYPTNEEGYTKNSNTKI